MSLAGAVHALIVDIDNVNRLFQQLQQVPDEVQDVFGCLDNIYTTLISIGGQLSHRDVSISYDHYVLLLKKFRSSILDLELFIDPDQALPRSGLGSKAENAVTYGGLQGEAMFGFCDKYKVKLANFDKDCLDLLLTLDPKYLVRKAAAENDTLDASTPPILAIPSPFLKSPMQTTTSASPNLSPIMLSPTTSPNLPPAAATPMTLLNLMSGTPPTAPITLPNGDTLGHLPAANRVKRYRRPGKTLADRRLQQMLERQYGGTLAAGVKRKRINDAENAGPESFKSPVSNAPFPPNGSPIQHTSSTPPPSYPPSSPRLGPRALADDREHPTWSLDDLAESLPTVPPKTINKGKQRATDRPGPSSSSIDTWETGSSIHTGSSANSIRSSVREGSILSTASHDRTFDDGAVKLWYHRGRSLEQVTITHIEVRRTPRPGGDGLVLILRTAKGQDIIQGLWIPSLHTNASPFLENVEIVAAMRVQHDPAIAAVVSFAPNVMEHPQYSFSSREHCQDFVNMVVGKTMISSVDISTIKSAITHGNAAESGCQTIQVWEANDSGTRTIKFFRNKNTTAVQQVVEVDLNCIRAPEKEGRTGKLLFAFRDVLVGAIKEMKYLKVAFSNETSKEEFLRSAFPSASSSRIKE